MGRSSCDFKFVKAKPPKKEDVFLAGATRPGMKQRAGTIHAGEQFAMHILSKPQPSKLFLRYRFQSL